MDNSNTKNNNTTNKKTIKGTKREESISKRAYKKKEGNITNEANKNKGSSNVKSDIYAVVIKLQSYDHKVLDNTVSNVINRIKMKNMSIFGPIPFPTARLKFVTRRAPNIYKVSFEKFEYMVHRRVIYIKSIDSIEKLRFLGQISIPQIINIKISAIKEKKKRKK